LSAGRGVIDVAKTGKVVETVTQINNIHENAVVQTGQRPSAARATGFQDSLSTALAQKSADRSESRQAAALCEPQATQIPPAFASADEDISCRTDNLLGLLESYASGLGNPGATLKDLAPLVDRMKDEADRLMASADKTSSAGSELKDIATQTALTATLEYIKFQRGDYT